MFKMFNNEIVSELKLEYLSIYHILKTQYKIKIHSPNALIF